MESHIELATRIGHHPALSRVQGRKNCQPCSGPMFHIQSDPVLQGLASDPSPGWCTRDKGASGQEIATHVQDFVREPSVLEVGISFHLPPCLTDVFHNCFIRGMLCESISTATHSQLISKIPRVRHRQRSGDPRCSGLHRESESSRNLANGAISEFFRDKRHHRGTRPRDSGPESPGSPRCHDPFFEGSFLCLPSPLTTRSGS